MSPEATVETISFGHADRQVAHRLRGDRRVARAADGGRAVEAALGVQAREHRRRAAPHGVDRRAAVGGAHELGVVGAAARARPPRAPTSGCDLRLAEDAGVDEQDVDAGLAQAVAQEAVLDALRVQRADEDDGGHQPRSTPR